MSTQVPRVRVAVIGSGIAGITAAQSLQERGFEVMIFEERLHLGGKLGAHPGRVPFNRHTLSKVRSSKQRDGQTSVDGKGEIQRDIAKLVKALNDGRLDLRGEDEFKWIPQIIASHFEHRLQSLGRKVTVELEHESREKISDIDHNGKPQLDRSWKQVFKAKIGSEESKVSVCLSIRQRFDGKHVLEFTDETYHEHCYHMYLNWYRNFWELLKWMDIEKRQKFISFDEVVHLLPGKGSIASRCRRLRNPASVDEGARNLLSGAGSTSDVTLWLYSMADLVSHQFDPSNYLDRNSVHAFLSSRWYATEGSCRFHEHLLAKAFAVPTYFSSAYTYRKYIEYSLAVPCPMLWVLKENSYDALFKELERKLSANKVKFMKGARVTEIWRLLVDSGEEGELRIRMKPSDLRGFPRDSDSGRYEGDDGEDDASGSSWNPAAFSYFHPDYVVLAVPPHALTEMSYVEMQVGSPHPNGGAPEKRVKLTAALSSLSSIRKLKSGVTAVLDLHFFKKLNGIPREHSVLLGSDLGLTFIDNGQLWRAEGDRTHLSVAVTDFYKVDGLRKDDAIPLILEDLQRFIPFDNADVDFSKTYLQKNDLEPLFINEVGSEAWRPGTITDDPRVFLAGDYVDNPIGVVSVEAAVVSGLQAVRAIQAAIRRDRPEIKATEKLLKPVEILLPETEPKVNVEAYKAMFLNDAVAAFTKSRQESLAKHPHQAISPSDLQRQWEKSGAFATAVSGNAIGLFSEFWRWVGDSHSRTRR